MRIQWFPIVVAAIVGGFGSASLYPLGCRAVWGPLTGILGLIGVVSIDVAGALICGREGSTVRRFIALACTVVLVAWTEPASADDPKQKTPPKNEVTVRGFRLEGITDMKKIPLTVLPKGPRLETVMTKEELDATGVIRLPAEEKANLEKWLGKIVLFTAYQVIHAPPAGKQPGKQEPRRPEKVHYYHLPSPPSMLSEKMAIELAKRTLSYEGYTLAEWELTTADFPMGKAPDGTPDKYFDRFSFRPTEGRVHFKRGNTIRSVNVHLKGESIECFMFYGL